MNYLKLIILPFLAGFLYALGFPSVYFESLFVTSFIGSILFFSNIMQENKLNRKIVQALFFLLAANLTAYYWLPHTLQEFGSLPYPLAVLLWIAFTLIILPYIWPIIFLVHYCEKFSRFSNLEASFKIIIYAFLFTLLEKIIPTQFPAYLGHVWYVLKPYLGTAPILGVYGYSFFSYLLVLTVCSYWRTKKIALIPITTFFLFVLFNLLFPLKWQRVANQSLKVRIVQANIGNFTKLDSEAGGLSSVQKVTQFYKEQSMSASEYPIDLLIWPETAYPHDFNSRALVNNPSLIPRLFQDVLQHTQADLITGGYDLSKSQRSDLKLYETHFNSTFLFSKELMFKNVYHKHLLIPFGETLPFGTFNPIAYQYIPEVSMFAKGSDKTLFTLSSGHTFISAICYEILYTEFLANYLNQIENADFIVNLTNDSWYVPPEHYQHLFLASWRALEFQKPLLRSTNSGISLIVYPDGSESQRLGIGTRDTLDTDLYLNKTNPSIYQRFGFNLIILLFAILLLINYFFEKQSPAVKDRAAE